MSVHKLHLYTGPGKGKTTAAMGLALRALGHGQRVLIAQFMKNGKSGELTALANLPGATVSLAAPISKFTFSMNASELDKTRMEQTGHARSLIKMLSSLSPDTVILDELAVAVSGGFIDEETARMLISLSLSTAETVVTGRNAPDWLRDMSDYMSVIVAEKHPYNTENLPAREGVEW